MYVFTVNVTASFTHVTYNYTKLYIQALYVEITYVFDMCEIDFFLYNKCTIFFFKINNYMLLIPCMPLYMIIVTFLHDHELLYYVFLAYDMKKNVFIM